MKLCKKWQDLGWEEIKGFYSETYRRFHKGKTQIVCQNPGRTMWRAFQYDELDFLTSEIEYPTISKALSSLNNP